MKKLQKTGRYNLEEESNGLTGMAIGGLIGAAVGGSGGAVIGGLIGAALGSSTELKKKNGR